MEPHADLNIYDGVAVLNMVRELAMGTPPEIRCVVYTCRAETAVKIGERTIALARPGSLRLFGRNCTASWGV